MGSTLISFRDLSLSEMKLVRILPVVKIQLWSCPVSVDTLRLGNQAAVEASFS
jgi:hypothetical protein